MYDVPNVNALFDRGETLRRSLYRQFVDLNRDPDVKESFVKSMYALLEDVRYHYTRVNGPERSMLYNIARTCCVDLETMLGVTTPEDCLPFPPPPSSPPSEPFAELQLTSYIRRLAQRISDDHATHHPHMGADANRDWHDAEIYFARDVLVGAIRLDTALRPESYWRLENIWLSEVLQLGAYHEWETRGRPMDNAHQKDDYYVECARCTQLLVNPGLKAPPNRFVALRTYFLTRYIQAGTNIDIRHDMARQLVDRKINRMQQAGKAVDSSIRDHVIEYITDYYNNIVVANDQSNRDAAEAVINAFRHSQGHESQSSIINAFEAAVAIYFIDSDVIQQLWKAPIPRAGIF